MLAYPDLGQAAGVQNLHQFQQPPTIVPNQPDQQNNFAYGGQVAHNMQVDQR